jgi:L-ascorbate metabolism protein UlaG (beta-lactamase superfamily)
MVERAGDRIGADLEPFDDLHREIPFRALLVALLESELRPDRFVRRFETLFSRTSAWKRGDVALDRFAAGGYLLSDRMYFPRIDLDRWRYGVYARGASGSRALGLFEVERPLVRDLAQLFAADVRSPASRKAHRELLGSARVSRALAAAAIKRRWPAIRGPGVYRREHACLAIRSRSTTVVLDPISLEARLPAMHLCPELDASSSADAVLITHSHGDHWHLPSIFARGGPRAQVIVPSVPCANLLCPTVFVDELEACGARAVAAKWWTTIVVGDIEIDVLPFYGEQPTRDAPGPLANVRSWGNCYRINTPDFSIAVAVDGGTDPAGSMAAVMAASCAKRGPLDVLLSSTANFESPFSWGLPEYWACLRFQRLRELYAMSKQGKLPETTAGIDGLVEICAAGRVRYFAPYAQGFSRIRAPITDIGWTGGFAPSERSQTIAMRKRLRERRVPTTVLSWNPGQALRFGRSAVRVVTDR